MVNKAKSIFNLKKKAILSASLLTGAVIALGATTVYAENNDEGAGVDYVEVVIENADGQNSTYTANVKESEGEYWIQIEDGKALHSTDGGVTWSEGMPEGEAVYFVEDGEVWAEGMPPADSSITYEITDR